MMQLSELEVSAEMRPSFLSDDERLRWVPEYRGRYAVTDTGKVISFAANGGIQELSPGTDRKGYKRVGLYDDQGDRTFIQVHRLVLFAFEGKPHENEEARHLDGNPSNNHRTNLTWGTISENRDDARRHGTLNEGGRNGGAKLTRRDVVEIRQKYANQDLSQREIAKEYEVSRTQITRICSGDRWACAGGPVSPR